MSKHMLCTGRIVRGGAVEITAPPLEERLDAAIALAGRLIAMNDDFLASLGNRHFSEADSNEMENEWIGREIGQNPWQW